MAAAISSGVPKRPDADPPTIWRMPSPWGPASSASPMGVVMTPGLIELSRAWRSPHARLAVWTRARTARLA